MKTLTIGDLHGLPDWKKAGQEQYDTIIFLGDYLDSFHLSDQIILRNLEEVIRFKQTYPDKVVLLWGNHEISYLHHQYRATGYRIRIGIIVKQMLNRHQDLFQVAFQVQNYLWTHAGVHQDFYDQKIKPCVMESDINIAATLERLFKEMYPSLFEVGPERGGWDYKSTGGPFWLDSSRLLEKPRQGYHQIVGHTPVQTIEYHTPYKKDLNTSVTLCDCIERGDGSFYELEI
jgi:predicted MPP superfamily phosphohydrolase